MDFRLLFLTLHLKKQENMRVITILLLTTVLTVPDVAVRDLDNTFTAIANLQQIIQQTQKLKAIDLDLRALMMGSNA